MKCWYLFGSFRSTCIHLAPTFGQEAARRGGYGSRISAVTLRKLVLLSPPSFPHLGRGENYARLRGLMGDQRERGLRWCLAQCWAHSGSVSVEVLCPGHGCRKKTPESDPGDSLQAWGQGARRAPQTPPAWLGLLCCPGWWDPEHVRRIVIPSHVSPISGRNWKPFLCSVTALRLVWQIR